ncbi:predicted protein [Uncinocarpus reesii 1704]|uniref:DNA replication checkpoint mediator MRC1 domain-containing protein n=1 Tax=Uncinocarpus reesii (strain UAMH 1704) TaxID=336963 RepID=C4JWW3_UNCRE|nr:uncharacterized protein UREG_06136 [Uncinocarpus reesii 1704]EEP81271.1 predicted protein [Uncinocarpus reesii 1704]
MSSPSTPRSIASRQSHSEGEAGSPGVLTPGRKIKALLAEFDTDSESEGEIIAAKTRGDSGLFTRANVQKRTTVNAVDNDGDDDNDDVPVAPRGRLAARLHAASEPRENQVGNFFRELLGDDVIDQGDVSEDSQSSSGDVRLAVRNRTLRSNPSTLRDDMSHRASSPLFIPQDSPIRPTSTTTHDASDAESEVLAPEKRSRLQALVEQKRKEREEKERLETEKRAERMQRLAEARMQLTSDAENADGDEQEDAEAARKLSQYSRPARKASKKALLEMNRETQRMSRNMQLAHQATTKRKFTLSGFIERFNQKCNVDHSIVCRDAATDTHSSAIASSVHHSDDDNVEQDRESTPPTSPLPYASENDKEPTTEGGTFLNQLEKEMVAELAEINEELGNIPSKEPATKQKDTISKRGSAAPAARPIRVQLSRQTVAESQKNDSDSDLEIVTSPAKARKLALFENFSAKSSASADTLRKLKLLARITSPKKNRTLTRAEHEQWLFQQARKQAAQEREEKIAALRARGVILQTAEEKAHIEDDVENLMERALEEAEELARKEKAAKKKAGERAAELDDSEDAEYDEGEEDEQEMEDGDDEEDEVSEEGESDDGNAIGNEELIMGEAADESDEDASEEESPNNDRPTGVSQRQRRPKFIVSDDEDDEKPAAVAQTPVKPFIPGLGPQTIPLMGLSQAFAATLAEDHDDSNEQDSLAALRQMPEFDVQVGDLLEPDSQHIVRDSQAVDAGTLDLLADFTQHDARILESPAAKTMSDYSQIPEPSQDVGFVMSPFDHGKRFLTQPNSTLDTVLLRKDASPIARREGRRLKRGVVHAQSDTEDGFLVKPSAFDVMRKAAKKPVTPFDKKNSKAKQVVDEAAEESEDEYAGLGGASDDDSGEDDELDLTMINDNSAEVVDEQELAALNADHARQKDEGEVNKLLRDITTGALRRKRGMGDDFDLSDSDDERIAARRRAKQREFAKMRKALLADENITKLADDPKKQAFFKTIEDRDVDDGLDFLRDEYGESNSDTGALLGAQPESSQSASDEPGRDGRKRPLNTAGLDVLNRPPAKLRRTAGDGKKKPSTLAEIRAQLSSLIGEPDAHDAEEMVPDSQPDMPNDEDAPTGREESPGRQEPAQSTNPRRRGKVVDRLSLRRAASSNAAMSAIAGGAGSGSSSSKFAFHTSTTAPEFKSPPPLLLRRTTTNSSRSSSSTSSSSSGVSTPAAIAVVKSDSTSAGGANLGKKGAVNYYAAAREKERELQLKRNLIRENAASRKALEEHRASREKGLTGLLGGGNWE